MERRAPAYTGPLCKRGHQHKGRNVSLRFRSDDRCVLCYQTAKTRWLIANADKHRAQSLASYYRHRDRCLARMRVHRQTRAWKAHFREYYNRPEVKARWRRNEIRYRHSDKGRLNTARKRHKRAARLKGASYTKITGEYIVSLRRSFRGRCAYCSRKADTLDHFIPLCRQGPHALGNILPACRPCNGSKNGQDPISWFKRQPTYSAKRMRKIRATLGKP